MIDTNACLVIKTLTSLSIWFDIRSPFSKYNEFSVFYFFLNNIHGTHTHKQTDKEFLSTLNDFVNRYPEEQKQNRKRKRK